MAKSKVNGRHTVIYNYECAEYSYNHRQTNEILMNNVG